MGTNKHELVVNVENIKTKQSAHTYRKSQIMKKSQEKKKKRNKETTQQTDNNKMAIVCFYLLTITLNVNELNYQIKN